MSRMRNVVNFSIDFDHVSKSPRHVHEKSEVQPVSSLSTLIMFLLKFRI